MTRPPRYQFRELTKYVIFGERSDKSVLPSGHDDSKSTTPSDPSLERRVGAAGAVPRASLDREAVKDKMKDFASNDTPKNTQHAQPCENKWGTSAWNNWEPNRIDGLYLNCFGEIMVNCSRGD